MKSIDELRNRALMALDDMLVGDEAVTGEDILDAIEAYLMAKIGSRVRSVADTHGDIGAIAMMLEKR